MPKFSENISKWMSHKGVGLTELISKTGISQATIYRYLNGDSEPSTKKLNIISSVFGILPEDLLRSPYEPVVIEEKEDKYKVPLLGYAQCGMPTETWSEHAKDYKDAGEIKGLVNPFLLEAKGRSMFPYIYEKDYLLCSEIHQHQLKNKMLVVVAFKTIPDTTEANAKFILLKKKYCILYSVNTNFEPVDIEYNDIHKIYKVVRIIRKVA